MVLKRIIIFYLQKDDAEKAIHSGCIKCSGNNNIEGINMLKQRKEHSG